MPDEPESNEPQTPSDAPVIEEVRLPAEVAEQEDKDLPNSDRAVYVYVGEMRMEIKELRKEFERFKNILADFEDATADALEAEAVQDEKQSEVIDEIAAKVLPDSSEAAQAHNPDHQIPQCSVWESVLGGCPKR